ncbi:hypothetical protein [Effusibacillus pohliae]|uniref:hypothetical protein n=1 Tax=Effusibacillus pohliae TaxID=232270 RepID=UPI000380EE7D|nr:hypothetical protein [Effusibacillus pohliae]
MYYTFDWRQYSSPVLYPTYPVYGHPAAPTGTVYPGVPAPFAWPGTPTAQQVLSAVEPVVRHGIFEGIEEGQPFVHVVRQVAAIAYLMGMGMPYLQAVRMVESWEVDEKFPGFERENK